ncbi:MAG: TRAP transporter substrate-binding protein [Butyricicoccus sp.]|nr:TRAP transporter substrate-binding protein [Butyricicoccus sp.]
MRLPRKILALALVGSTLLINAGCEPLDAVAAPDEQGELVVSIAYDSQPDSVTGIIASSLAEKLEEKSGGKITAHVYPSGQLGSDKELIQSCISGDVEFVVQNHSAQVNDIVGTKVLDMPYLFPNIDIARATLDDPEFREVYDALYPEVGLKLLMISDMGYRQTSSNRKLETLEDFKGLDIRTMENPIHLALWKALGANPTPMNRSEVFLALQQGLLMAQEDPYVNFLLNNYQEVQTYAVATNHLFHDITVITNDQFYQELPAEYQGWIDECCEELLPESRAVSDDINNEQDLIDAGMEVIHLSDEVFNQIAEIEEQEVWPMIREEVGDELTDALLDAVDRAKAAYGYTE